MKKFAISLIALAALSTASFASDATTPSGKQDTHDATIVAVQSASGQNALAIPVVSNGHLTAFERMKQIMEENSVSRH